MNIGDRIPEIPGVEQNGNTVKASMVLLLAVCMVAVCMACHAQNSVRLYLKSGETVSCFFSEKPEMTYSGNDLVVSTSKASVIYPLARVSKMCFEDEPTAVDKTVMADVRFTLTAEALILEGEKGKTDVTLYDLNGAVVIKGVTDTEGRAEVSIGGLVTGIYIVKTASLSFKIAKP